MLDSGSSIVVDKLLDLGHGLLPRSSWLIDWHLNNNNKGPKYWESSLTLIVSSKLVTTMERRAEYSVWIIESSTDQKRWNFKTFSYHWTAESIWRSGWFPTQ